MCTISLCSQYAAMKFGGDGSLPNRSGIYTIGCLPTGMVYVSLSVNMRRRQRDSDHTKLPNKSHGRFRKANRLTNSKKLSLTKG